MVFPRRHIAMWLGIGALLGGLLGPSACVFGDLSEYEQRPQAPERVGCADGIREGFRDVDAFPDIAGCALTLSHATSMRKLPTGRACGNSASPGADCLAPQDACAPGWELCLSRGYATDITGRIGAIDCQLADQDADGTLSGRGFLGAASVGYGAPGGDACAVEVSLDDTLPCADHSAEKECIFCCGTACQFVTTSSFAEGFWGPVETPVFETPRCDSVKLDDPYGVLCCRRAETGESP